MDKKDVDKSKSRKNLLKLAGAGIVGITAMSPLSSAAMYLRQSDGDLINIDSLGKNADDKFSIFNAADTTKILDFDISGVTTGNTRTVSVLDSSGVMMLTDSILTENSIPYIGASGLLTEDTNFSYNDTTDILSLSAIQMNLTPTNATYAEGKMVWNPDDETIDVGLQGGVVGQMFEEAFITGQNDTGGTLENGTVATYAGSIGASGHIRVANTAASGAEVPILTVGIVTQDIVNGSRGKITTRGKVRGIQTDGVNYGETWSEGEILYKSSTVAGGLTNVEPNAPIPAISLAVVISAHPTNGTLLVRPTFPQAFTSLTDVNGTALTTTGQIPVWNETEKYFDFDYNLNDVGQWERDAINGYVYPKVLTDSVGIGTDSPTSPLTVSNSTTSRNGISVERSGVPSQAIQITTGFSGNHEILFQGSKPAVFANADTTNDIAFEFDVDGALAGGTGTRAMIINRNGNVGINTGAYIIDAKLQIHTPQYTSNGHEGLYLRSETNHSGQGVYGNGIVFGAAYANPTIYTDGSAIYSYQGSADTDNTGFAIDVRADSNSVARSRAMNMHYITGIGNAVGINVLNPEYLLDVGGDIQASGKMLPGDGFENDFMYFGRVPPISATWINSGTILLFQINANDTIPNDNFCKGTYYIRRSTSLLNAMSIDIDLNTNDIGALGGSIKINNIYTGTEVKVVKVTYDGVDYAGLRFSGEVVRDGSYFYGIINTEQDEKFSAVDNDSVLMTSYTIFNDFDTPGTYPTSSVSYFDIDSFKNVGVGGLTASMPVWTDENKTLVSKDITFDVPISLETYDPSPSRGSESDLHGGLQILVMGQPLDSTPTNIVVTKGTGKVLISVNAGTDIAGTITITGTSVDRNTGVTTPADTATITVDTLTTNTSTTDSNGNTKYSGSDIYIGSKWFTGTVTLSTTDLTLTDVDVYHLSYEQFNDSPNLTIETFDQSLYTTNTSAEFDSYLQSIEVTGDKAVVSLLAEVHIGADGETAIADKYWRLRRGNINKALDGTTDGVWITTHYSNSPAYIEDVSTKVWASKTITVV